MATQCEMSCVPEDKSRKDHARTKCLMCCKPYHTPKVLNCFHTFCVGCLLSLVKIWTPLLDSYVQQRGFPCPSCQQIATVPKDGVSEFRDNEYLVGISEEQLHELQSSSGFNTLIYCLVCDNGTPVHSACVECRLLLCRHCQYFHGKFEGSKEHTLHELDIEEKAELLEIYVGNPSISVYSDCGDGDSLNEPPAPPLPKPRTQPPLNKPLQQVCAVRPPLPPRPYELDVRRKSSSPAMSNNRPMPQANALDAVAESESDSDENYDNVEYSKMSSLYINLDSEQLRPSEPPRPCKRKQIKNAPTLPLSAPRVPATKTLLPPARKWRLKWPEANVRVISVSSNFVYLFGTGAKKQTKLGVFNEDGTKVFKIPVPDIRTMAVLDDSSQPLLLFGEEGQALRWSSANKPLEFKTIPHISLDGMMLSKSVPRHPVYVVGSNEGQIQIQKVEVERSTPHYLLDHKGDILAFDVSRHETHFALLRRHNDLMVDVYEKQGKRCKHVSGYTFDDKRGTGDVCFYVPKGVQMEIGEILVVADYKKNQLLLLDYMSGCRTLDTVDVTSPASLAKDGDWKLWLNCKVSGGKSEIMCF